MIECVCTHPRAIHRGPEGPCGINGCKCEAFRDPDIIPEKPKQDRRRVCVDVPDGYVVQINLVPVEEHDDASA